MRRAVALLVAGLALAAAPAAQAGITYDIEGTEGANGWYVSPVLLTWHVSGGDPTADSSCQSGDTPRPLPNDTADKVEKCDVPNVGTVILHFHIDQTPPTAVAAVPARPPDVNGWFSRPVQVSWTGLDATSGIAGCTSLTYSGPDAAGAAPAGTCQDRAGNVSATVPFALNYDATAPAFQQLSGRRRDGTMTLSWTASPDTQTVTITRKPDGAQPVTFAGPAGTLTDRNLADGVNYTYVVTAVDTAGNVTTTSVRSSRPSQLLAPKAGARLRSPPLLRWRTVKGADYYNVQLFDGARKLLSIWPKRAQLRLRHGWRFGGRARALRRGHTYRWYVWPGFGRLSAHRYGRLLGVGSFTIRRRGT